MAARLLFVGDIHLGRRPSRWSDALRASTGIEISELTPAAAWRRTVKLASELDVDAVVLAGDVVDHVEDRFEAASELQRGIERLAGRGIGVLAVAGNHDVEALPRVAAQVEGLRLIGSGGHWEAVRIEGRDGTPVEVWGWSFPTERVEHSPLDSRLPAREAAIATLGVLHCDLDAGRSAYAPVSSRDLAATGLDAWLLGHVHKPHPLDGDSPTGYLGSLVGLDPGEPGPHGPWLAEVDAPGRVRLTHRALAPIRWERADLELGVLDASDDHDIADALGRALAAALRSVHDRIAQESRPSGLRAVGCRVHVSGRGRHHAAVHRLLADPSVWPERQWDGVHYFVEAAPESTAPDLDLAELARGADPPGLLARRLLALERGDESEHALHARIAAKLESELSTARWQALDEPIPDEEALSDRIARARVRLLDALLDQQERAT